MTWVVVKRFNTPFHTSSSRFGSVFRSMSENRGQQYDHGIRKSTNYLKRPPVPPARPGASDAVGTPHECVQRTTAKRRFVGRLRMLTSRREPAELSLNSGRLVTRLAESLGCCRRCAVLPESSNHVSSRCVQKLMTRNPFLSGEFLADQFARDQQRDRGRVRESLGTAELGIRGTSWSGRPSTEPFPYGSSARRKRLISRLNVRSMP